MRRTVQQDLIVAAQHGDHEAFEALAIGASRRLYSLARLILRDAHLAEDAVQETLVAIWRKLPTLREPERFDAWTYRLLVNSCANVGRDIRRADAKVRLITPNESMDDPTGQVADREQLEQGFHHLRPDQRAAIVLHFYLGLTAAEVADVMGIPVGTAKSRLHYATEVLRAALDASARPPAAAKWGGR